MEIDRLIRRLHRKIENHRHEIIDLQEDFLEDADIGIFAYGSTARSARQAVMMARQMGLKAGLMRPRVIWPFPEENVVAMAEKVHHIIVPELNLGQIAHEVEWATCRRIPVVKINRVDGEPISPQQILDAVAAVAG